MRYSPAEMALVAGDAAATSEELQRCRGWGWASDIVQETFLDARKDFGRFEGRSEAELRYWLRRILRNNLLSFVRRFRQSKREARREAPIGRSDGPRLPEDALVARTESPNNHAIRCEQARELSRVLDRLPERQKSIIRWRHQEHCAFDEIGRRLGVTADAARMSWARAIRQLQREFGTAPADKSPVASFGR